MKESGIGTDMTELEVVLEELIEKDDVAETKQRVFDNQKTMKDSQDRVYKTLFSYVILHQQQQQKQMQDFQAVISRIYSKTVK